MELRAGANDKTTDGMNGKEEAEEQRDDAGPGVVQV
jgi:hypothetical protein